MNLSGSQSQTIPHARIPDPRRWVTLAIIVVSVVIVVLDNTVLNVAIPTILREFHTDLPSLQWVITGYALTFATLLIIGGRLGDIYGHRRTFIVGAGLFAFGSLIASLSGSVPVLVVGEAFIEGVGASLMLPATLAILSNTFAGQERATAFAAWGAVAGAAGAFGPLVGGFLTTNYSWRWSFRINVIVAPLAIVGSFVFIDKDKHTGRRSRLDVPGALLVALGMFLMVFALSEGGRYGWSAPARDMTLGGFVVWPKSRLVAATPVIFALGMAVLACFYWLERSKERRDADPLFEFGQLRHKGFRYGLLTAMVLAMGQFGLIFVLPVFLQDGKHLSAQNNGLWLLPSGIFIIVGAQLGGRLTRRFAITTVVRTGLILEALGMLWIALSISPSLTFRTLLVGFALYGVGIGFATSQLTNVVLSDISRDKAGVASGANATVRQVGSALGVAVMGALLAAQTVSHALQSLEGANLPSDLKASAVAQVHTKGVSVVPPAGTSAHDVAALEHTLVSALSAGSSAALFFTSAVVVIGAAISFLIPHTPKTQPPPAPAEKA